MPNHISFPSISQFKDVIKHIQSGCKYHSLPPPTVTFHGSVKLHGTNAAVCRPLRGTVDDIFYQSRERIITPESDNAGFAMWAYGQRQMFNAMFDTLAGFEVDDEKSIIQRVLA